MAEEIESVKAEEVGRRKNLDLFDDTIPDSPTPIADPITAQAHTEVPKSDPAPAAAPAQPSTGKKKAGRPPKNAPKPGQPGSQTQAQFNPQQPGAPPQPPPKTPEEIRQGAEMIADLIITGYEKLHGGAKYLTLYKLHHIEEEHNSGKIDLNFELELLSGDEKITGKRIIEDYKKEITNILVVTPTFKREVRPALIRVCIKHGWTITDEVFLLLKLFEDLSTKVSLVISTTATFNNILEYLRKICQKRDKEYEEYKKMQEEKEKAGEGGGEGKPENGAPADTEIQTAEVISDGNPSWKE